MWSCIKMVCPTDKIELSKGMAAQLAADEAQELSALEAAHVSSRTVDLTWLCGCLTGCKKP